MAISSDRLKPFPDDLRRQRTPILDAAQEAGTCLRMMQEAREWKKEALAPKLGISVDELTLAENGQFVERTSDGRLIDFPAALLVLAARIIGVDKIPLPPAVPFSPQLAEND
jgi:hypothetical protein